MSETATMRAIVIKKFADRSSIALERVTMPVPASNQILVEVAAAPLNYVDLIVMAGKYQFPPPLPYIPGKGPAGTVRAVGSEVTSFAVGDRVLAMVETTGWSQFIVATPANCYRIPDRMSFVDAASMSLIYDTSWFALRDRARVASGETVLVLGSTGGVGQASIQLAKAFGAKVLAGVSSPARAPMALAAGADGTIDLSAPDLRESLRAQVFAINGGRGVDVVIDPVGGDLFDAALRALDWRGRLVVIGFAAGRIPTLKANYLLVKNIEVSGLQVSDYRKRRPDLMAQCYREVFEFWEAGRLSAPPSHTFKLDDFTQAIDALEARADTRRIVFDLR